jgi:nucleotide-binding universal stress UspA family protein
MKMNGKILVGFDGSAKSEIALDEAISLAEKFRARIIVVHIAWNETNLESHTLLNKTVPKLEKTSVKYDLKSIRSEYIPRGIIRIAMDEACDLIVLGSRGLRGGKAWVLGSVTQKVLEDSPMPVYIVK